MFKKRERDLVEWPNDWLSCTLPRSHISSSNTGFVFYDLISSSCVCVPACVWVHACGVCVHMYACAWGGQRLTSVFPSCSPSCSLRQNLLVEQVTSTASLSCQLAISISCLCLPSTGITSGPHLLSSIYMDSGNTNSSFHDCVASALITEPFSQPCFYDFLLGTSLRTTRYNLRKHVVQRLSLSKCSIKSSYCCVLWLPLCCGQPALWRSPLTRIKHYLCFLKPQKGAPMRGSFIDASAICLRGESGVHTSGGLWQLALCFTHRPQKEQNQDTLLEAGWFPSYQTTLGLEREGYRVGKTKQNHHGIP